MPNISTGKKEKRSFKSHIQQAFLRLRGRLGVCCVELHYGTVLRDELCSSLHKFVISQ